MPWSEGLFPTPGGPMPIQAETQSLYHPVAAPGMVETQAAQPPCGPWPCTCWSWPDPSVPQIDPGFEPQTGLWPVPHPQGPCLRTSMDTAQLGASPEQQQVCLGSPAQSVSAPSLKARTASQCACPGTHPGPGPTLPALAASPGKSPLSRGEQRLWRPQREAKLAAGGGGRGLQGACLLRSADCPFLSSLGETVGK